MFPTSIPIAAQIVAKQQQQAQRLHILFGCLLPQNSQEGLQAMTLYQQAIETWPCTHEVQIYDGHRKLGQFADAIVERSLAEGCPIPMELYTPTLHETVALKPLPGDRSTGAADLRPGRQCLKLELNTLLDAYTRNLESGEDEHREEEGKSGHTAPGHLIFFEDGNLQGGAVDESNGTQLRVRGSLIQSGRDCLRDDDWQVYQLCVSEEGRGAVRMLAGKSGGDAAKLEAPLEIHGTEEDDFRQQLVNCSDRGKLAFHCSVLYEGSKAKEMQEDLGLANPMEDAIVNAGEFTWDLQLGNGFTRGFQKPEMLYDSDLDS